MASDKVVTLTVDNFEGFLASAGKPVLVDFFGAKCGPCVGFALVFEKIAEEFDGLVFAKVDASADMKFALKYGIRTVPVVKLFRSGSLPETVAVGSIPVESLREKVAARA